jgi:hypothetical protein
MGKGCVPARREAAGRRGDDGWSMMGQHPMIRTQLPSAPAVGCEPAARQRQGENAARGKGYGRFEPPKLPPACCRSTDPPSSRALPLWLARRTLPSPLLDAADVGLAPAGDVVGPAAARGGPRRVMVRLGRAASSEREVGLRRRRRRGMTLIGSSGTFEARTEQQRA